MRTKILELKPLLMNRRTAAAYLGVSPATLTGWQLAGQGPAYTRLGEGRRPSISYRVSDLDAYVDSMERVEMVGGDAA